MEGVYDEEMLQYAHFKNIIERLDEALVWGLFCVRCGMAKLVIQERNAPSTLSRLALEVRSRLRGVTETMRSMATA